MSHRPEPLESALTGARMVDEVGDLLTLDRDPEAMLGRAFQRLGELVPFDLATVLLREEEDLVVRHASGPYPRPDLLGTRIKIHDNPRLVVAMKARQAHAYEEDEPGEDTFHGILDFPEGHSCLVAPLRSQGEIFGIMTLDALVCRQYPESVVRHVGTFASLLALALKQAEHLQQLAHREQHLQAEVKFLRDEQMQGLLAEPLRAESPALRGVVDKLRQVAPTTATVLITGETGTGKEKVAQTLHHLSPRREKPFIKVNCGALPGSLIESELFGHVKGAFTGASAARKGRFELADGGTLFLDEVGELPLDLQPRLLRVLQEGEIDPVGSEKPRKVDVRLIAATNRDLEAEVEAGRFRADLYYRLGVFPLHLPPLRERPEDVRALAESFLDRFARTNKRPSLKLTKAALARLEAYAWPGNVRELFNVLERAAILSGGRELELDGALPEGGRARKAKVPRWEEMERDYLEGLMRATRGKVTGEGGAAALADLAASTLISRLEKLGLKPADFRR
ncbi:MAG TPA: sigma 54-interacting transcriptional regulator [Holophagaceae bacterium]|nr:sigma 54-interacting transcriptional regulator [Holophagaceae bacterium]